MLHRPLLSVAVLLLAGGLAAQEAAEEADQSLNLYQPAEVGTLDPCFANDSYSNTAISQVAEPLYQYSYLVRPYTLEPCLADSMGTWSEDRLTYTIKLKPGVRYADDPCFPDGKGRELRASDFLFAWKRLADIENRSPGWWIFEGRIAGLDAFRERFSDKAERDRFSAPGRSIYDEAVEGLQAPDPHTLVIQLTEPLPIFPYLLAMSYTAPLPPEAWHHYGRGEGLANHAVGTGAYRVESFKGNSKIVYVANPSYRKETYPDRGMPEDEAQGLLADRGKPLPFAPRVVVQVVREDLPRWLLFSAGQLDFLAPPKDNFDAIVGPDRSGLTPAFAAKGMRLQTAPLLDVTYTAFNMEDPLLGQNKYLRQAICLADAAGVMDEIRELRNGRAIPAYAPIPPGIEGYREDLGHPYRMPDDADACLELARELMEQAGFAGGGVELTYETLSSEVSRQFAEQFADCVAEIGIELKINPNTWPAFDEKIRNRKAQIWGVAWAADYPDPENFLQLLYGPNASPGPNGSNFHNARYDELYSQLVRLSPGDPERQKIIDEMVDTVQEECPWSPGVHRITFIVIQGWLRNYKYADIGGGYYKYYRVDGARKRELLPRFQGSR